MQTNDKWNLWPLEKQQGTQDKLGESQVFGQGDQLEGEKDKRSNFKILVRWTQLQRLIQADESGKGFWFRSNMEWVQSGIQRS